MNQKGNSMNIKNIIISFFISLLFVGCLFNEAEDCSTSSTDDNSLFTQNITEIPVEGLIAYYPFNNSAKDESISSHDGVVEGANFNKDFTGQNTTLAFDGINDFVELDRMEDLNSSLESFSVSFWIKSDSKTTNQYQSIFKTINSAGSGTMLSMEIHRGSSSSYSEGVIRLDIRDDDDHYFVLFANRPEVFDNKWHNITFVITSSAENSGAIYIDGDLDTTEEYHSIYGKDRPMESPTKFNKFDFNLTLGAGNNRGNVESFFEGSLDEVAFYNRALASEDLIKIVNRSKCQIK
jgi:hypothetical protein